MIRSTLFISAALAAVSVVLTSLWIGYGPRPQVTQEKQASTVVPLSKQERTGVNAKGQAIRTITPGTPPNPGTVETPPTGSAQSATAPINPPATPKAPVEPDAPVAQRESASNSNGRTDGAPVAANDSSAAIGGSIDLNTAPVEQLNGLGAGMIGKRIIEFRPYTSVDELLSRRVLKRADYETIRPAVMVR